MILFCDSLFPSVILLFPCIHAFPAYTLEHVCRDFHCGRGSISSEALRKGARLSTVGSSVDIFACCPVLYFVLALFNGKDYFSTLS